MAEISKLPLQSVPTQTSDKKVEKKPKKKALVKSKKVTAKPVTVAKPEISLRVKRRLNIQRAFGFCLAGIATALTFVSMSDIAHCAINYLHVETWKGWAFAGGLDTNYMFMELLGVFAAYNHVKERAHKWTRFAIPGVMCLSASANVLEFLGRSDGSVTGMITCVIGGIFLPLFVFVGFRLAAIASDI